MIYHTDSIVLDAFDIGETDRMYVLFTKEFGLVRVFAKSVRAQSSKLKSHLQLFSYSRVSFVLGRAFPRLIDAEEKHAYSFSEEAFFMAGRMGRFLLRVIQGEERDMRIWEALLSAFHFLQGTNVGNEHGVPVSIELLFQARMLYYLGYVDEQEEHIRRLLRADNWNVPFTGNEENILQTVCSKGIRASHL